MLGTVYLRFLYIEPCCQSQVVVVAEEVRIGTTTKSGRQRQCLQSVGLYWYIEIQRPLTNRVKYENGYILPRILPETETAVCLPKPIFFISWAYEKAIYSTPLTIR